MIFFIKNKIKINKKFNLYFKKFKKYLKNIYNIKVIILNLNKQGSKTVKSKKIKYSKFLFLKEEINHLNYKTNSFKNLLGIRINNYLM